jgi:hypothetical protein
MPRGARLDAPGTLHHVIGRGIAEIKIFRTKRGREDFLRRIATLCLTGVIAVKKLRYTGASVTRFLGVTTSVVNRSE